MIAHIFSSSIYNMEKSTARRSLVKPTTYIEVEVTLKPTGYFTYEIRIDKDESGGFFKAYNQVFVPDTNTFFDVVSYRERASIVIMSLRERTLDGAIGIFRHESLPIERISKLEILSSGCNKNNLYDASILDTYSQVNVENNMLLCVNFWCSKPSSIPVDSWVYRFPRVTTTNGTTISSLGDTLCYTAFLSKDRNGVVRDIVNVNGSNVNNADDLSSLIEQNSSLFGQIYCTTLSLQPYSSINFESGAVVITSAQGELVWGEYEIKHEGYPSDYFRTFFRQKTGFEQNIDLGFATQDIIPPHVAKLEILGNSVDIPAMHADYHQAISVKYNITPQGTSICIEQSYLNVEVDTPVTVRNIIANFMCTSSLITDVSALASFNMNNLNARELAVKIPSERMDFDIKQSKQDAFVKIGTSALTSGTTGLNASKVTSSSGLGMASFATGLITSAVDAAWTVKKAEDSAEFAKDQLEQQFDLQMNNLANQKQTITGTSDIYFKILGSSNPFINVFVSKQSKWAKAVSDKYYARFGFMVNVHSTFDVDQMVNVFIKTNNATAYFSGEVYDNRTIDLLKQLDIGVLWI